MEFSRFAGYSNRPWSALSMIIRGPRADDVYGSGCWGPAIENDYCRFRNYPRSDDRPGM